VGYTVRIMGVIKRSACSYTYGNSNNSNSNSKVETLKNIDLVDQQRETHIM